MLSDDCRGRAASRCDLRIGSQKSFNVRRHWLSLRHAGIGVDHYLGWKTLIDRHLHEWWKSSELQIQNSSSKGAYIWKIRAKTPQFSRPCSCQNSGQLNQSQTSLKRELDQLDLPSCRLEHTRLVSGLPAVWL